MCICSALGFYYIQSTLSRWLYFLLQFSFSTIRLATTLRENQIHNFLHFSWGTNVLLSVMVIIIVSIRQCREICELFSFGKHVRKTVWKINRKYHQNRCTSSVWMHAHASHETIQRNFPLIRPKVTRKRSCFIVLCHLSFCWSDWWPLTSLNIAVISSKSVLQRLTLYIYIYLLKLNPMDDVVACFFLLFSVHTYFCSLSIFSHGIFVWIRNWHVAANSGKFVSLTGVDLRAWQRHIFTFNVRFLSLLLKQKETRAQHTYTHIYSICMAVIHNAWLFHSYCWAVPLRVHLLFNGT